MLGDGKPEAGIFWSDFENWNVRVNVETGNKQTATKQMDDCEEKFVVVEIEGNHCTC